MGIEQFMVVKRNGEVVQFDSAKIQDAILKAVKATGQPLLPEVLQEIVINITSEIEDRFIEFYPNVENIQDIVEKHLVKRGLYEIAKAYILYRAKRQKEREEENKLIFEKARIGKLRVVKDDGRIVLFDFNKLKNEIWKSSQGYEDDISVELIAREVVKNIYDGVTIDELQKAVILATTSFIERDPAYSFVAGRLFIKKIFREVAGDSKNIEYESFYKQKFIEGIKEGVEKKIFDKRLLNFDISLLAGHLDLQRDELLQFMGIQTLYERYFAKYGGRRIEMPQSFWMRISMGLAMNEADKNERALEFYDIISSLRYIPSTPTLFHSGTAFPQLSSCFLNTVEDDLKHIFKTYLDTALMSKFSGGIATDWTNIRATGAIVKTVNIPSQGVIPFLKIANDTTVAISRSGRRKGATCVYLETWHLDIEDFLELRKNTGDERRRTHDMNTANWIPDLFMKRVLENGDWTLFSPDEVPDLHHLYGKAFEQLYQSYEEKARRGEIRSFKVVSAAKLWKKMMSMLFETGHPWITFKDPCNIRSPQDHCGVIHNSNLCTEITLNNSAEETAVCNLGSINLQKHIHDGKFDVALLQKTVYTAIRMLDNIIDLNFYPTKECEYSNLKHRPIGLGVMGFQDALYMLDIPFDSQEAVVFSDQSMEIISYFAILSSSALAKERGTYATYKGSKWDRGILPIDTLDILEQERGMKIELSRDSRMHWNNVREHIKQYGMRNSNVMAIAPTATISTIAGCFPCIEPIYKNIYVKANMSGEFVVVNPYLVNDLKQLRMWNQEILDQIKYYDGSIQMIAGIPDALKRKYQEAFEIDSESIVRIAAARGKWIDQSQSLNIFMRGTSGKKLSDVYFLAWSMGLKTTYYLRTLAASQIEKSTLDASKFGFTQKREYKILPASDDGKGDGIAVIDVQHPQQPVPMQQIASSTQPKVCLLDDPECEACQ